MTKEIAQRGRNNAAATLAKMQSNVRASVLDPRVWETAHTLVLNTPARDEVAQAAALRTWMLKNFHFVKDPIGKELLEAPNYQLDQFDKRGQIEGDCDDASTLAAALLSSIGIPAKMVAVDIVGTPRGFDHVFTVGYPIDAKAKHRVAMEFDVTRPPDLQRVRFRNNSISVPA